VNYIIITYGLLLIPFLTGGRDNLSRQIYVLVLLSLFLFSAFRFEVGCDWGGYYFQYIKSESQSFDPGNQTRELLWWGILSYLSTNNIPYPFINVISSAIFFSGIHILARRQLDPLSFLVFLFPVLIVNMPMSAIRQSAAIGFICVALVSFIDRKPVHFTIWTLIAAGFHASAMAFLVLMPLSTGKFTRTRLVFAAISALPGAYLIASGSAADIAIDRYVENGRDAAGAAFRVGVLLLSGLLFFLLLRKAWARKFPGDFHIAYLFAIAMTLLIAAVPVSSVIGDRLGYYLVPVQAMIFARIPFLPINNRQTILVLPYIGLATMFTVWALMSGHFQRCYIPYQTWLFGFPSGL